MKPRYLNCLFLVAAAATACLSTAVYSQPKKPSAAGATVSEFRTITIISQPKAGVWLDGVFRGRTNADGKLVITTVPSGGHTIRLRADGYKEKSQPLAATQKGEVSFTLVKTTDPAELTFQSAERLTTSDRDKSAEAYREAISIRPNYPEAYLGLARVLAETGDLEEAKEAITAARRLRPGYAEASAVEGRIFKEYGEGQKAVAAFKRAITEGKGFQPEAYTGLGLYYKEQAEGFGGAGDFASEDVNYNDAAKNLKIALKQLSGAPDTMIIYQLLGLVYERQKRFKDAIATYEEFLRIFPDTAEATAVRSFIVQLKKAMNSQN